MATSDSTPTKTCRKCGNKYTTQVCRPCKRAADKRYRAEHPEVMKAWRENNKQHRQEYMLKWRDENAEHIAEYQKRYLAEHVEQTSRRRRRYYEAHAEQEKAYQKRYYNEHAVTLRQDARRRAKQYRCDHPDRVRENKRPHYHIRRMRQKSTIGTHTAAERRALFSQQNGKCWYCGCKLGNTYHADHRIPIARGGSNDISNIVLACPECNLSKGSKLPHEWSDRLL